MGLAVCFGAVCEAYGQMPPQKVVVAVAELVKAPSTIVVVGTVEPLRRSQVASEAAGRVVTMPARQGDRVEGGGLLCELRDDDVRYELFEAKARLAELKAHHEELINGARPEDLKRLKALMEEAAADYERWKKENDRITELSRNNESYPKEVYDTQAEFRRAERMKIAAEASYERALAGEREEVIQQAAHRVVAQEAVVSRWERELDKMSVRAPFAGYVVRREVEVGEWIQDGGTVVEIVDLSVVLVHVDAPESALPFLAEGKSARVAVDALKRTFEGKIKHIIRQADTESRAFRIEIEVDNDGGSLAAGMFAKATIPAGPDVDIVAVPKDATVEMGGIVNIGIVMPGPQGGMNGMLMPVTVGAEVGNSIAITSGNIQPGMQVIVRGNEVLMPFPSPVLIVDKNGTPVPTNSAESSVPAGEVTPPTSETNEGAGG